MRGQGVEEPLRGVGQRPTYSFSQRMGGLESSGEVEEGVDTGHGEEGFKIGFACAAEAEVVVIPIEEVFGGGGEGESFDGPIFGGPPEVTGGEVEDKVGVDDGALLDGDLAIFGLVEACILSSGLEVESDASEEVGVFVGVGAKVEGERALEEGDILEPDEVIGTLGESFDIKAGEEDAEAGGDIHP